MLPASQRRYMINTTCCTCSKATSFLGGKVAWGGGAEVDRALASSAEVKNEWK